MYISYKNWRRLKGDIFHGDWKALRVHPIPQKGSENWRRLSSDIFHGD